MAAVISSARGLFARQGAAAPGPVFPSAAAPQVPAEQTPAAAGQTPAAAEQPTDIGALWAQQAAEQAQLTFAAQQTQDAGPAAAASGQTDEGQTLEQALLGAQEEARAAQSALLAQLTKEDDTVKTLIERMKEAKEQAEKIRKQFTLPKNGSRYSLAAVEAYAKLSRARSQSDVSAAASYARRQLMQCKNALRQDSGNAERIRAAVRQLESAVARAGRKKRDLEEERLTEKRRARAVKSKDRKKAAQLKYELRRRQTSRMLREQGYVNGAVMDGVQQAHLAQQREEQRQAAERVLGFGTGVSADTAAQRYLAQQAAVTPALDASGAAAGMPAVELEG